jgi:tRNA 5-methylaminomethyl-2-thiouridine biosynthesis bifunctional protein
MTSPSSPSQIDWTDDGAPRSQLFDDVYFSKLDGLAESRAVFLEGCALPEAWQGRQAFVVGELGFGTGLNILALLDLWRRTRAIGARLHIFSIEAHPLTAEEAGRALGAWPELDDLTTLLIERWPRRARGFHRIDLPELGATLDLAIMDAAEALAEWTGAADAWFLDGFAPDRNPGMWSEAVLAGVAIRSAPGARAATFTVAGAVRRGLAAHGFAVEKRPGFGRKKQRLEAVFPGPPADEPRRPTVAIVGAGIAGAALARAFANLGLRPVVIDAGAPGSAASRNPAAMVMPRLDAGSGPIGALYAQAFARAADIYSALPTAVIARGVVQVEAEPKDAGRFDRIAASDLFEAGRVRRLDGTAVSQALAETDLPGGLDFVEGLVVEPALVLDAWLAGAEVRQANVAALLREGTGWRLLDRDGASIVRADVVCLAGGAHVGVLIRDLTRAPLQPVRGQVSHAACDQRPDAAIWGGYAIPTRDGVLFGATHDRDDTGADVREDDHARNLDMLAQGRPALTAALRGQLLTGRAGIRAVTPDFLPLAGAAEGAERLFLLAGLGSRGFCAAPLLAEHVAALALGAPSPLPRSWQEIVDPHRFALRLKRRRGRSVVRRTLHDPAT